jgi:hypothetical protein
MKPKPLPVGHCRQGGGAAAQELALTVTNLATPPASRGRREEAHALFRQALPILERALGPVTRSRSRVEKAPPTGKMTRNETDVSRDLIGHWVFALREFLSHGSSSHAGGRRCRGGSGRLLSARNS